MSAIEWKGLIYKVFHFQAESPLHLQAWLERMYVSEGLNLISANVDYYIFEPIENATLKTEIERLRKALEEICDLARTGLPPVEMTEPYWQQHRANKIASIAHRALKGGE